MFLRFTSIQFPKREVHTFERIKKLIKDYSDDELEQIYLKEHPERQKLIEPVEISWEQKLNEWKAKAYQGKDFEE